MEQPVRASSEIVRAARPPVMVRVVLGMMSSEVSSAKLCRVRHRFGAVALCALEGVRRGS
ncbi:hypothetical protein GCM10025877_15440 [Agromyces mangrovi Wang et al. 2018]|nr:hypothetical protein GCM10025877_15440 [Agromyces mangrovi]